MYNRKITAMDGYTYKKMVKRERRRNSRNRSYNDYNSYNNCNSYVAPISINIEVKQEPQQPEVYSEPFEDNTNKKPRRFMLKYIR